MKKLALMLGAGALMATGIAVPAVAQGGGQGHQAGGTSHGTCGEGALTASPGTLWPPNHKMHDITVAYSENDGEGSSETLSIKGITVAAVDMNGKASADGTSLGAGGPQHDPDYGTMHEAADGTDGGAPATAHIDIRSERSGTTGNGSGRVYTLTVTCHDSGPTTDPSDLGEASPQGEDHMGTVNVCVPHDMSDASRTFCDGQMGS